jgi:hypothetical protein
MNPIAEIGRYQIPIASIVLVEELSWLQSLLHRAKYKALLASGHIICLTKEEKQQLDEARGIHEKTIEVLHQVAGMQRNNRSAAT